MISIIYGDSTSSFLIVVEPMMTESTRVATPPSRGYPGALYPRARFPLTAISTRAHIPTPIPNLEKQDVSPGCKVNKNLMRN